MNLERHLGTVRSVHAWHVAQFTRRWGVDPADVVAPIGIPLAVLAEPNGLLDGASFLRVVDEALRRTREPSLGFYLGLSMRASAYGYVGFAALAAPTLRDALMLAVRYAPTRTDAAVVDVTVSGPETRVVVASSVPLGLAEGPIAAAALVGFWKLGEFLTGAPAAAAIELVCAEPPTFGRVRPLIAVPVRFERPANVLTIGNDFLDRRIRMADAAAYELVRVQCERELEMALRESGVVGRVRSLLSAPTGGFRTLKQVASAMQTSASTLKRKLASEGTTFFLLVDAARRERAMELLTTTSLPMDEVRARLGYSDAANFHRAVRRWTGKTPGALRAGGANPERDQR